MEKILDNIEHKINYKQKLIGLGCIITILTILNFLLLKSNGFTFSSNLDNKELIKEGFAFSQDESDLQLSSTNNIKSPFN